MIRFLIILLCITVPIAILMPGHDPQAVNILNSLQPPSPDHWLGTDSLGRDVCARLIQGGMISLLFALVTALFSGTIGICIGLTAGLMGGWVERALMRLCDLILALPLLPFLIVLAAIDPTKLGFSAHSPEARLWVLTCVIALFAWPGVARLVRAGARSAKHHDYVMAAKSLGVPAFRIAWRHILPMVAAPVLVALTLAMGQIILLESTLSFLGLGLQPPTASWGSMLNNAQNNIWTSPLLAVWPGLAIALAVISLNITGDWLRDRLDPYKNTTR